MDAPGQRAPHAKHMHDRKDARAPVPCRGRGDGIGEEIAHMGIAALEAGRRAWTDQTVDLACREHLG